MTISFLEFGEEYKDKSRKIWGRKENFQAYEWFMGARYFADILAYERMKDLLYRKEELLEEFSKINHKNDVSVNLGKLIALSATSGNSFCELGSSLFGCIEAMEFCKSLLLRSNSGMIFNLNNVNWHGVDISEFMNSMAKKIHSSYHITTSKDIGDLKEKRDVFFAKGISLLYAIRNEKQLIDIIKNNEISIFDYSFSLEEDFFTTIGTGVETKYININKFLEELKKTNRTIFVNTESSCFKEKTVFLDIVGGYLRDIYHFISEDYKFRDGIARNLDKDIKRELLLEKKKHWIPIEKFVEEYR